MGEARVGERPLPEQPAREMLRQLERLRQVDDAVLAVMHDLAATLDRETRRIATLVAEEGLDAVNARLAEPRVRFRPIRGILADASSRAFRVQAHLIEPAAAEPGAAPEERLARPVRGRLDGRIGKVTTLSHKTVQRGLAFATASLLWLAACGGPLGPFAGGRLAGERAGSLPSDWSFTGEVMIVQLETRPDDPYSVNVGCIDHAGAVYVGSAEPESSRWVANLVRDPSVRLRVRDRIFELRAIRVTDPNEWTLAGRKLYEKYDIEAEPGRDPGWLFRLEPR